MEQFSNELWAFLSFYFTFHAELSCQNRSFFASDDSGFMTGIYAPVNGGFTMEYVGRSAQKWVILRIRQKFRSVTLTSRTIAALHEA